GFESQHASFSGQLGAASGFVSFGAATQAKRPFEPMMLSQKLECVMILHLCEYYFVLLLTPIARQVNQHGGVKLLNLVISKSHLHIWATPIKCAASSPTKV